jgi:hypothetical protein
MGHTPKDKAFELYYEFSKRIDFIDNEQELDIATKKCVIYHIDELLSLGYSRPFYDEVKEEILNYKDVS